MVYVIIAITVILSPSTLMHMHFHVKRDPLLIEFVFISLNFSRMPLPLLYQAPEINTDTVTSHHPHAFHEDTEILFHYFCTH